MVVGAELHTHDGAEGLELGDGRADRLLVGLLDVLRKATELVVAEPSKEGEGRPLPFAREDPTDVGAKSAKAREGLARATPKCGLATFAAARNPAISTTSCWPTK